jgi:hypothetical protein
LAVKKKMVNGKFGWTKSLFAGVLGFVGKKKGWLQLVGYEIEERETTRMEAKRSRFTVVQLKKKGSWLFG